MRASTCTSRYTPPPKTPSRLWPRSSPEAGDEIDYREKWSWVIATRLVGEGSVREARSGSFSPKAA